MWTAEDTFIVTSASSVQVLGHALNWSIVWYVGSLPDSKRTMLNRLLSFQCAVCSLAVSVNLGRTMAATAAASSGGLGAVACDAICAAHVALFYAYFLLANVVVLLRYVYVCHLKKVLHMDEDILVAFWKSVSAGLTALLATLAWFAGRVRLPFWFRCARGDAEMDPDVGMYNIWLISRAASGTLLLHLAASAATFAHKRRAKSSNSGGGNNASESNHYEQEDKKTLIDARTSVLTVLVIFVAHGFIVALGKVVVKLPSARFAPYVAIWLAFVQSVVVPGLYFARNGDLRAQVAKAWRKSAAKPFHHHLQ